ncbi:LADA_0C10792g1_1 [Lachancea dasiensis]|uniref:1,3-beta-glucanosyltransferase n=1 Tax=Lachancea dasiensis TaxID=1072105 RepID=A0A1G4J180_9SACH|nr:LADA_0C10792g1_1 [Lachancea dasiensis]
MNLVLILTNVFITYFVFASGIINAEEFKLDYSIAASELPPVEVVGNKFFNTDTKEQFFIKGIAYQPSHSSDLQSLEALGSDAKYIDPLASPELCLRDVPYLANLGVNTIRVYSIDPNKSHDVCMKALLEKGIYVLVDLSEPDASISRDTPNWDARVYQRYKNVVDAMHQYPNVLGFFAGNEVTNDITNTDASPFVKASIRDVKEHISKMNYREIPVGYSTNDDEDTRENLAKYFTCGESIADFYGVNMYEWCGYSSFHTSGYDKRTQEFRNYPVPIFFSEFGCNLIRPRPFTEVEALYSKQMTDVWSGGLAYMYFEEENHYGVVKIDSNNHVVVLKDFEFLRDEFARANPKGTIKSEYLRRLELANKKPPRRECPALSSNWKAAEGLPATPNQSKCACLDNALPCLVSPFSDRSKYREYFEYICGEVDCTDIAADGENGRYGEFSDCSADQKLALEISKMFYSGADGAEACPIADENIHFNSEFKNKPQDPKCATLILSIENVSKARTAGDRNLNRSNNGIASSGSHKQTAEWILFLMAFGIWTGWLL